MFVSVPNLYRVKQFLIIFISRSVFVFRAINIAFLCRRPEFVSSTFVTEINQTFRLTETGFACGLLEVVDLREDFFTALRDDIGGGGGVGPGTWGEMKKHNNLVNVVKLSALCEDIRIQDTDVV